VFAAAKWRRSRNGPIATGNGLRLTVARKRCPAPMLRKQMSAPSRCCAELILNFPLSARKRGVTVWGDETVTPRNPGASNATSSTEGVIALWSAGNAAFDDHHQAMPGFTPARLARSADCASKGRSVNQVNEPGSRPRPRPSCVVITNRATDHRHRSPPPECQRWNPGEASRHPSMCRFRRRPAGRGSHPRPQESLR